MHSPHLDREWLYQKYIVEKLSTYQIGRIVKRDPKRIYDKLKDFQINTRPRGENLKKGENSACYMLGNNINPFSGKKHTTETRRILSDKAKAPKPHLRGEKNGMFNRTGDKNPNYKDGSSPERQRLYSSLKWKKLVRSVFERDNFLCQHCGCKHANNNRLHAHHIKVWADYPEFRFDIMNLITLCHTCHSWVHSRKNINRLFLFS